MRSVGFVLAAGAVVLLAACGSSGTASGPATQPTGSTSAPTTAATGRAVVMTASNAKLGTVLVDRAGKTLYTLKNAAGKAGSDFNRAGPASTALESAANRMLGIGRGNSPIGPA